MLALCLISAIILRFASLGDPDLHVDEAFYFYVGQQMHHGAVPYVDIWDRKPLGLFILYWIFAGISASVWSYQLAALISVAATSFLITRIVKFWAGPIAQGLAALTYLALLHPLNGHGGQGPVFYNLAMTAATLCTMRAFPALQQGLVPNFAWLSMALCGLALSIKQTTLFEGVFLALWMLGVMWIATRSISRIMVVAASFALLGALPMLLIGLWYYAAGYWPQFWFAMVTSNTVRPSIPMATTVNIPVVVQIIGLILAGSLSALLLHRNKPGFSQYRGFLTAWLIAAIIGFASVGSFLDHHALSLLPPLCVIASVHYERQPIGPVLALTISFSAMAQSNPFAFSLHQRSRQDFQTAQRLIATDGPDIRLLVYDGPLQLYATPGVHPLTRLIFPMHFNSISEIGTSYYPQTGEVDRILAQRPTAVVWMDDGAIAMDETIEFKVRNYVRRHCHSFVLTHRWQTRGSVVPIKTFANCR